MHFIQVFWETFWTVLGWFWKIIMAFGDYLGVWEGLAKYVIAFIVLGVLACTPFSVSNSDKRTARNIANIVVNVFSYIRK